MKKTTVFPDGESTTVISLEAAKIRRDGGTQMRTGYDEATVEAYKEDMLNGDQFEPIEVYFDGTDYWLADGFHRLEAFTRAGKSTRIDVVLHSGTRRDAVLHAAGANAQHGLRRGNADKRLAVQTLLEDEEWGKWSNREIARQCRVSEGLVRRIRDTICVNTQIDDERTVRRGDTEYTMQTGAIGTNREPAAGEGPAPEEQGHRALDVEVLAAFLAEGPKTHADLWNKFHAPNQLVYRTLAELEAQGRLDKPKPGTYGLRQTLVSPAQPTGAQPRGLGPLTAAPARPTADPDYQPSGLPLSAAVAKDYIIDALKKSNRPFTWLELHKYASREAGRDIPLSMHEQAARAMLQAGSLADWQDAKGHIFYHFPDFPFDQKPKPAPAPHPTFDQGPMAATGKEELYTPARVIALVTAALGVIDLDPASCAEANQTVQARRFFDRADDGLAQSWHADTLYLNPPYGRGINAWIKKLVSEYEAGHFQAAITLIPARTDTAWFRRLRDFPKCFVAGRLKFEGPDAGAGDEWSGAPFPSCLVYLGPDFIQFAQAFASLGDIYTRWHTLDEAE